MRVGTIAVACLLLRAVAFGQSLPHNIPNFCASPTITSAGSGAWSSPATWVQNRTPAANDIVRVATGHVVTYATVSDVAPACVGLDGTLTFSTSQTTRLTVGTLMVFAGGSLIIGTVASPVQANVLAEIVIADRPLNTATDPEQYGTGLLGFGTVTIHGAVKTPYVRLAAEVSPGNSSLTAGTVPSGWPAGDRLALPDSKHWGIETFAYTREREVVTLAGAVTGTSLPLTAATAFKHPGAKGWTNQVEFYPHAANLTRNVVIRSANPSGTRGHVLFTARATIDIRYAAWVDLGRTKLDLLDSTTFGAGGVVTHVGTNQIGRYAMHFHHLSGPLPVVDPTYQYRFEGNVVERSSKWGIAIHNSHYGHIADNVVNEAIGSGLMTEDGNETGNVIERNAFFGTDGTFQDVVTDRGSAEFGFEGAGMWLHGPNNIVRDNIVGGSTAFGITLATRNVFNNRLPNFRGADTTVDGTATNIQALPILEMARNEIYGSKNGLTIWDVGVWCCQTVYPVAESVVKDTRLWHISRYGYYGYGHHKITFDGWVQRGPTDLWWNVDREGFQGFHFEDYIARIVTFRRLDLLNLTKGINLPGKAGDTQDMYGTVATPIIIEDSHIRAVTGIVAGTPWAVTGGGVLLAPVDVQIRRVKIEPIVGLAHKALWMAAENPSTGHAHVNHIVPYTVQVTDWQQVPGDSFRAYWLEQAPSSIVPVTTPGDVVGAPIAGLTNTQAMAQFGIAVGGAMAPCSTTRAWVVGFTCATVTSPPPAPARNLTLTR